MTANARQNRWKWIPATDPAKINALLESRRMTQSDLARILHVHPSRVNRLCSKPHKSRQGTIESLCKALGCQPADLT